MLVRNLLESKPKEVVTAYLETSIVDAMDMLINKNIGCLPIINDNGNLVGIISDKDIFKKIHETDGKYHSFKVEDIMSSNLIVGIPDDDLTYIAGIMEKNWIRHVPIIEGERIVGLVSQRDIIKTQAENVEIENRYLKLFSEGLDKRDKSADI